MPAHFIVYVQDQGSASAFWRVALGRAPRLDVPGMTEFALEDGAVLGLMPEAGIRRLVGVAPGGEGVRCELYLHVPDPAAAHARALAAGARELSPPTARDWGDLAAYSLAPDGVVLAFAAALR